MSEQDYWHKIGGQRWLGERLVLERKKIAALERIADALELHANLLLPDAGDKNDEGADEDELRPGSENQNTEEAEEGR